MTSIGSHRLSAEWWHFQCPSRTLNPVFKVTAFLKLSNLYQKRCILRTKLLKDTNRKPYIIYQMVPLSMTLHDLWLEFKVRTFFEVEYLKTVCLTYEMVPCLVTWLTSNVLRGLSVIAEFLVQDVVCTNE